MFKSHKLFNRRLVLRGLGGVVVGLPMLDIFEPRDANPPVASCDKGSKSLTGS